MNVAMTRRLTDLVSAAIRHVRDAEHLLTASPDQAWHLAGFGPKCIRKAVLTLTWADKALDHALDGSETPILDVALALDAHARRHVGVARLTGPAGVLGQWRVEHRYERTGSRSGPAVATLVATCRAEVDHRVALLFADGLLVAEVP